MDSSNILWNTFQDYQVSFILTDHLLVKRFDSFYRISIILFTDCQTGCKNNMPLIIVISTGDFQIRCNVLSLSFSERESGKWPLALNDFSLFDYVIISSVIDCIQHSGEITICNT